ncbi:MAG: DUF4349 domain-containing protein [Clostridia bacterium]|nr:DUF4349 domain-containing protein [Clostridia bacterium]
MNKADMFDTMSGVSESFLAESENTAAVRKEFRRGKKRRVLAIVASCCCVALCVGIFGAVGAGLGNMGSQNCVKGSEVGEYFYGGLSDGDYAVAEDSVSAPASVAPEYTSAASTVKYGSENPTPAPVNSEKLVYTCRMQLETLEYAKTVAAIRSSLASFGGFVQTENETNSDRYWYYTDGSEGDGRMTLSMILRVPSAHYEEFLAAVEANGHVIAKNADVENISRTYNDTQVLISALEQQETRLLEMMEKAETIEDMITVEKRLTEVQTELNQYRTDLSAMDTDVDLATVSLEICEVRELSDTPPVRSTFGTRLANTFKRSWRAFSSGMEDVLFGLIFILPFAAVIAVIAVIVILIVKKKRKKKAK